MGLWIIFWYEKPLFSKRDFQYEEPINFTISRYDENLSRCWCWSEFLSSDTNKIFHEKALKGYSITEKIWYLNLEQAYFIRICRIFWSNYPTNLSEKALFSEKETKKKNWFFFEKNIFKKNFLPIFLLGRFLAKNFFFPLFYSFRNFFPKESFVWIPDL